MYGLLLALHHRARRISLNVLLAYVGMFLMLSLAHTCGTLRQGDGTPAHAHKISAPPSGDLTPAHDCLACAWERNTTATTPQGSPAWVELRTAFTVAVPAVVALHAGAIRLLPSRGPPAS